MGKTGKQTSEGKQLAATGKELTAATRPVRNEFSQQLLEILQTGGSTARLPIIQNQVEGAKTASAQATQGTTESLAAAGLDRTPFGQNILAQQRQSGAQAQNSARFNVVNELLGVAPNYSLQAAQTGQQGLAAAAQQHQTANLAAAQQNSSAEGAAGAIAASIILAML